MEGKIRPPKYSDEWLVSLGMPEFSTILMTPKAFMTAEAWDDMMPAVIKGLKSSQKKNCPEWRDEWWMVLSMDKFGIHCRSLKVLQLLWENRILAIGEETDSSHVAQAFDQMVALECKRNLRDTLATVTRHRIFSSQMTQWELLVIAAHCVRKVMEDPNVWVASFRKVNMHPHYRKDLRGWFSMIESHIRKGEAYQDEGEIDPRDLLPKWYQQWDTAKKAAARLNVFSLHCLVLCLFLSYWSCELLDQTHRRRVWKMGKSGSRTNANGYRSWKKDASSLPVMLFC